MVNVLKLKKLSFPRRIKNYAKQIVKGILLSKKFYVAFKIFIIAGVVGTLFYGAYLYIGSQVKNDVVVSKSEIIARVAKLVQIPAEAPLAVVRVEDPGTLKKQNIFYENAKVGDYILIYESEAIIYDLMNNSIVSVKKATLEGR